jgi:hypothetical protein
MALVMLVRAAVFTAVLVLSACDSAGDINGGPEGPGGAGDDTDGDGSGNPACEQVEPIQFNPGEPADLLLVVDKSGSMDEELQTGQDKWPVMRDALDTVVDQYDDGIRFGLMLYPDDAECATGSVRAAMAPQNGPAISSALGGTSPDGGTPTHTTLAAARSYYQGVGSEGARYVLLATDGEPNCGNLSDTQEPTVEESIAAIEALSADSIMTFVLGFGGTVNNYPEILQAMAEAGGTGDYFAANSPEELSTALDAIAGEVGLPSCSFRLDNTPGSTDDLTVYQDGDQVPHDPSQQQGWDWNPGTNTLTFYGQSCDDIRGGQTEQVRIEFGCDDTVE